jgi:hypothetical protein
MEIVQHVSDESLVRYAMHPLPDAEAGPLEEHLLICLECRDRLQAEIEFVTALSGAAAIIREQERKEVH